MGREIGCALPARALTLVLLYARDDHHDHNDHHDQTPAGGFVLLFAQPPPPPLEPSGGLLIATTMVLLSSPGALWGAVDGPAGFTEARVGDPGGGGGGGASLWRVSLLTGYKQCVRRTPTDWALYPVASSDRIVRLLSAGPASDAAREGWLAMLLEGDAPPRRLPHAVCNLLGHTRLQAAVATHGGDQLHFFTPNGYARWHVPRREPLAGRKAGDSPQPKKRKRVAVDEGRVEFVTEPSASPVWTVPCVSVRGLRKHKLQGPDRLCLVAGNFIFFAHLAPGGGSGGNAPQALCATRFNPTTLSCLELAPLLLVCETPPSIWIAGAASGALWVGNHTRALAVLPPTLNRTQWVHV